MIGEHEYRIERLMRNAKKLRLVILTPPWMTILVSRHGLAFTFLLDKGRIGNEFTCYKTSRMK